MNFEGITLLGSRNMTEIMKGSIVIFLLVVSCSLDPVIIEPETLGDYYISCTLSPEVEFQHVLLGKTVPESDPVDINDAVIYISSHQQNVRFYNIGNGLYQDSKEKLMVTAGQYYELRAELKNGHVIKAQTVLPDTIEFLSPLRGDTVAHYIGSDIDTSMLAKIKWKASENAEHFTVILIVPDSSEFAGRVLNTFRHEVYIPAIVPRYQTPTGPIILPDTLFAPATIKIIAHDSTEKFKFMGTSTYWRYDWLDISREKFIEVFHGEKTVRNTNIQGAIGQFNGVSVSTLEIVLHTHIY